MDKLNVRIKGYRGLWSVIDEYRGYVLLEHNIMGDETCYLVLSKSLFNEAHKWTYVLMSGSVDSRYILDKADVICETYDDLEQALIDEGII